MRKNLDTTETRDPPHRSPLSNDSWSRTYSAGDRSKRLWFAPSLQRRQHPVSWGRLAITARRICANSCGRHQGRWCRPCFGNRGYFRLFIGEIISGSFWTAPSSSLAPSAGSSLEVYLLDHRKGPRYRGPERIGNISALADYGAHSLVPFRVRIQPKCGHFA